MNKILIWIAVIIMLFLTAYIVYNMEIIKRHPCSLCANKTGEDITCYHSLGNDWAKFYSNGSIDQSNKKLQRPTYPITNLNISKTDV